MGKVTGLTMMSTVMLLLYLQGHRVRIRRATKLAKAAMPFTDLCGLDIRCYYGLALDSKTNRYNANNWLRERLLLVFLKYV